MMNSDPKVNPVRACIDIDASGRRRFSVIGLFSKSWGARKEMILCEQHACHGFLKLSFCMLSGFTIG